jgi:hypothetical protein
MNNDRKNFWFLLAILLLWCVFLFFRPPGRAGVG